MSENCFDCVVCQEDHCDEERPEIIYFDDEELDVYRGRTADSYSENEEEEFAYVLHTMRQEEAMDWYRSLRMRGITPPESVRRELLAILRNKNEKKELLS